MQGEIDHLALHPRFCPASGTDLPVGTGSGTPTPLRHPRRSNRRVAVALCAAMPSESEITLTARRSRPELLLPNPALLEHSGEKHRDQSRSRGHDQPGPQALGVGDEPDDRR